MWRRERHPVGPPPESTTPIVASASASAADDTPNRRLTRAGRPTASRALASVVTGPAHPIGPERPGDRMLRADHRSDTTLRHPSVTVGASRSDPRHEHEFGRVTAAGPIDDLTV